MTNSPKYQEIMKNSKLTNGDLCDHKFHKFLNSLKMTEKEFIDFSVGTLITLLDHGINNRCISEIYITRNNYYRDFINVVIDPEPDLTMIFAYLNFVLFNEYDNRLKMKIINTMREKGFKCYMEDIEDVRNLILKLKE